MRAISLWQPWASLMAVEAKRYETRSWFSKHRGELAICAAKCKGELGDVQAHWLWRYRDALGPSCGNVHELFRELPRGAVLCVVSLDGYIDTKSLLLPDCYVGLSEQERDLGDYSEGRFAWLTSNCRRLSTPVQVRGYQGLFSLSSAEELSVRNELRVIS